MFKFSIELSFVEFSPEQSIDYACFRGCNDHYKMKPFFFSPLRSVDMFFSFKEMLWTAPVQQKILNHGVEMPTTTSLALLPRKNDHRVFSVIIFISQNYLHG